MSDPTVLGMINNKLEDISADVKLIKNDMSDGRVKFENHELRLGHVETKVKILDKNQQTILGALKKHIDSKTEHFSRAIADEGVWSYAWRKKLQITIQTGIVTAITIGIGLFITWLKSFA